MECQKCGAPLTEENICCEGGSYCKECHQKEAATSGDNAVEKSGDEPVEEPAAESAEEAQA